MESKILQETKANGLNYNYLSLGNLKSVNTLLNSIDKLPEEAWDGETDRNKFSVHTMVKVVPIRWTFDSLKRKKITRLKNNEWYDVLEFTNIENELQKIYEKYYGAGFIDTIILALMPGNHTLIPHKDNGYSLMRTHRTHIPLITNKDVLFKVGEKVASSESKHMNVGEIWEINNARIHEVNNNGNDDRIHMIVNYYPYQGILSKTTKSATLF
tara:strand:+ start:1317 stop:1955 length:639 start_codon:yes stop_codon:yes gene_type:complete